MASFEKIQELLLPCLVEEIIDDEEFSVLYEAYTPQNLPFQHSAYEKFSLENKNSAECKADCHVDKRDIALLVEALRVPPIFKCTNGTICDGTEGLCIVLKRFAYPCRYSDMIAIFGRSVPGLSVISNQVRDWIYNTHGHKVTLWNHGILNPPLIATYADAVHSKGAALDNCFGFIDGTVRPISRPMSNHRVVYNGHKRVHALKFQAITLPNGLIANIYGPVGKPQTFFFIHQATCFPFNAIFMHGIFLSFHLPLTFALFSGEILVHNLTQLIAYQFNLLFSCYIPCLLVICEAAMT